MFKKFLENLKAKVNAYKRAEIEEEYNAVKQALNLLQRAIKKKLGLQFTKDELSAYGFDMNKVRGFNYNSGKEPDSQELLNKKKAVWDKIVELCNGNVDLAKKTLQKHTAYGDFQGHTDINKVSEKQLNFLSSKIENALKEQNKNMGGAE